MHVSKDELPLVAHPDDEVWIEFERFEALAVIWVEALSGSATVEIASSASLDEAGLTGAATLAFDQAKIVKRVLPPIGGDPTKRFTRVKVTDGRVSVGIASPSPFRHYMRVLRS